jgi:hypothetical protein
MPGLAPLCRLKSLLRRFDSAQHQRLQPCQRASSPWPHFRGDAHTVDASATVEPEDIEGDHIACLVTGYLGQVNQLIHEQRLKYKDTGLSCAESTQPFKGLG